MASVNEFINFISLSNLHRTKESLGLINFLKTHFKPTDNFELSKVESFLDFSMNSNYWWENKSTLSNNIAKTVEGFSLSTQFVYSKKHLIQLLETQYIKIKSQDEIKGLILKKNLKTYPNSKSFFISKPKSLLSVVWTQSKGIHVREYSNIFKIKDSELSPTNSKTKLFYNENLELLRNHQHSIGLDSNTIIYFKVNNDSHCTYKVSKGYTYSCEAPKRVSRIEQAEPLYRALKEIEASFVNPQTDSEYIEICNLLEIATNKLNKGEYESTNLAQTTLSKGKYFLNNVFPSDKMLTLLLTNLEYTLNNHLMAKNQLGNTNPWQKQL